MTARKTPDDAAAPAPAPAAPPPAAPAAPADDAATPSSAPHDLPNPISPEALKAFVHPLRIAMYQYLSSHGSGTASQIARALGESTGQTSYHLRQLERHGLIEDDPEAPTGGRERWWRPVGFSLDRRHMEDPASRLAVSTALQSVTDERARSLQTWWASIDQEVPWDEAALHTTSSSNLTLEEAEALGEELQAVLDRHTTAAAERRRGGDGAARRRVRAYIDVFPLPRDERTGD